MIPVFTPTIFMPKAVPPFDPTTLFSGDTGGWWDPSDTSTTFQDSSASTPATANNDPVARINDKSGNGNHLTNTGGSARPLLKVSSQNWLSFDGATNYLQKIFTISEPATRIGAYQLSSITTANYLMDGGGYNTWVLLTGSSLLNTYDGVFGPTTSMTAAANHVVTEKYAGTAVLTLTVDNNTDAVGSCAGTGSRSGLTVGGGGNTVSNLMNMLWFGSIAIGRVLTSTEIAQCRTFFGAKAGLTL